MKTLIIVFVLLLLLCIYQGCNKLASESYQDAAKYSLYEPINVAIDTINKFKVLHPELCPPKESKLSDGYYNSPWYRIYFYYSDKNKYLNTWVRGEGNKTIFAFVSISRDSISGQWQGINNDLKGAENDSVKNEFIARILNPIKQLLRE